MHEDEVTILSSSSFLPTCKLIYWTANQLNSTADLRDQHPPSWSSLPPIFSRRISVPSFNKLASASSPAACLLMIYSPRSRSRFATGRQSQSQPGPHMSLRPLSLRSRNAESPTTRPRTTRQVRLTSDVTSPPAMRRQPLPIFMLPIPLLLHHKR